MFNRLLVPLDGSRFAEAALPAAAYLAERLHAIVALVHFIESDELKEISGERHLASEEEAHLYLEEVAKRAFPPGILVRCHVHRPETGSISRSIVDYVGKLAPDLILMCAHRYGGLQSWLFSSIAQQVIARSSCPVLLIHPKDAETPPAFVCRNILVPLDGNPAHEQVIPVAAELATSLSAAVHLVTVVPTRHTLSGVQAALSTRLPITTTALLDLVPQSADDYLQEPMTRLESAGVVATARVQRGEPARRIAWMANAIQADLLVLGRHGKNGMDAFWEDSIAPQIARQTSVPMLLVGCMKLDRIKRAYPASKRRLSSARKWIKSLFP